MLHTLGLAAEKSPKKVEQIAPLDVESTMEEPARASPRRVSLVLDTPPVTDSAIRNAKDNNDNSAALARLSVQTAQLSHNTLTGQNSLTAVAQVR